MKGFNIDNPWEYIITIVVMPIIWVILTVFFPIYVLTYLIILKHNKYERIDEIS